MTSLNSLFESPFALIDHARDEIQDARTRAETFFKSEPYTVIVDFDPQTRAEVHKLKLTSNLPGKISAVVKDATGNLRDALDHAVYASALAIASRDSVGKTGFPFAKNAAGVQGELAGPRLSGNPPEIRPFLASLHPYEAGNPILWALNQVRNPNTHRVIVPVMSAVAAPSAALHYAVTKPPFLFGYSHWDPSKNEVEFFRAGRGSVFNYEVEISFGITFGDVPAVRGQEVFSTLDGMATEVSRIVHAVKAETERILRSRTQ